MGTKRTAAVVLLAAFLLLLMCGCGTSNTQPKVTTPQLATITIVSQSGTSIPLGKTAQFSATGTYTDGSTKPLTVTWNSSSPAVATIDANGLATSKGQGAATITGSFSGVSGTFTLTVGPAVLASIAVSTPTPSVALGLTAQFTVTGTMTDGTTAPSSALAICTFASSNAAVGIVDAKGTVTTKAIGSASISATCGTLAHSAALTVTPAVMVSIGVAPSSPSIKLGATQQFTATATMTDGTTRDVTSTVTWQSSDDSKVRINHNNTAGLAHGAVITAGSPVTITATTAPFSAITTLEVQAIGWPYGGTLYSMSPDGDGSDGYLHAFAVQPSGNLVEIASASPLDVHREGYVPQQVAADPNSRFVYLLYAPLVCEADSYGYVVSYAIQADGTLQYIADSDYQVAGCVRQFAIAPNSEWMYVAAGNPSTSATYMDISLYSMDGVSGHILGTGATLRVDSLTEIRGWLFNADSTRMYVAGLTTGASNALSVMSVDVTGGLMLELGSSFLPYRFARAAAIDNTGTHLYLTGYNALSGYPALFRYALDPVTGILSGMVESEFGSASGLEFEPALNFAYGTVDIDKDIAVEVFAQDSAGDLTVVDSTAPFAVDTATSIRVHPNGGLLYVQLASGAINIYALDPATGKLTPHSIAKQLVPELSHGLNGAWKGIVVVVPPAGQPK